VRGEQLASLVSWGSWTNRILQERKEKGGGSKEDTGPGTPTVIEDQDNKSGSKKVVRWDELVHVRRFQPFQEEFAKRNGSPRVRRPTRHHQAPDVKREVEEGSETFQTGWDSRYFTSPMDQNVRIYPKP